MLVPYPAYDKMLQMCDHLGINVKFYKLIPERNFEVDLEDTRSQIDETVKMMLVINPSNPCGRVMGRECLEHLATFARKHKLILFSDEIYTRLAYEEGCPFIHLADLCPEQPVITVNGLSKVFRMPSWRVGWVLFHDPTKCLGKI